MIDSQFHVELNGVKYRLAEDAGGQHYVLSGEPLRPPNSTVVQGETEPKFHMRPDTLLWTLTDWSGGEGQIKFDAQAPNRWRILHDVRAFDKPGQLLPGYLIEETTFDSQVPVRLVRSGSSLWGASRDNTGWLKWNGTSWPAAVTPTGPSNSPLVVTGDTTHLYWVENDTTPTVVWKWDGVAANATQISTGVVSGADQIITMGPYVYVLSGGTVYEIPKSGATNGVAIDVWDEVGAAGRGGGVRMAAMSGRLYVMVPLPTETAIREIVPSTAAGPGFGFEHGRLGGLAGELLWAHANLLFIRGILDNGRAAVMYYQPSNETYGTLGEYREEDVSSSLAGGPQASGALASYYAADSPGFGNSGETIVEIDAVGGGTAVVAAGTHFGQSIDMAHDLVLYNGDVWITDDNNHSTHFTLRARKDRYSTGGYAVSPWHDFQLSDEKVLYGIGISCMKLPTAGSIKVYYALDGDDSTWTELTTYDEDDGVGTFVPASDSSATITFRTISIKIELTSDDENPTVLLGVDVLASVIRPQRVWTLLLDLADDRNSVGATKIANLKVAAATHAVVAFKDGYQSRNPGSIETTNVIVDEYHINLSRPNEGVAQVRLREVS